ncbi:trypsin-like serine peptidase [Pelagerythrobacter rhizovicinus]|uniref:Trypsin-like serine protease n=1 Tax=Pelagerythrobacter rhizovicinus TaxID=2268576 RepID=A0A4Q2KJ15_9SPHN|nr:trypsin-like serine protease [Pelagerythrobacter rhizovicinus]RXZ65195.1 trypsin-like serine protease [Pelagerythrobacter rhizovicinus]
MRVAVGLAGAAGALLILGAASTTAFPKKALAEEEPSAEFPRSDLPHADIPQRSDVLPTLDREGAPSGPKDLSTGSNPAFADLFSASLASLGDRIDREGQLVAEQGGHAAVEAFAPDTTQLVVGQMTQLDRKCLTAVGQIGAAETARLARPENLAILSAGERAKAHEIATSCFSYPFADSSHPLSDFVKERAAILVRKHTSGTTDFCSALMLSDRTVATARHCLFHKGVGLQLGNLSVQRIGPGSGPSIPIAYDAAYSAIRSVHDVQFTMAANPPADVGDDFAVLRLEAPVPGLAHLATPYANDSDLTQGKRVYQAGFQWLASFGTTASPGSTQFFRDSYVVDSSPYCRAIKVSNGCIVQGCQSLAQTSGAALIVDSPEGWKLAGTLFGESKWIGDETKTCFDGSPSSQQENAAKFVNLSSRAR